MIVKYWFIYYNCLSCWWVLINELNLPNNVDRDNYWKVVNSSAYGWEPLAYLLSSTGLCLFPPHFFFKGPLNLTIFYASSIALSLQSLSVAPSSFFPFVCLSNLYIVSFDLPVWCITFFVFPIISIIFFILRSEIRQDGGIQTRPKYGKNYFIV